MKKSNTKMWLAVTGCALIVLAVVLMAWFLLRGQTTIRGTTLEIEQSKSLVCKANNYNYSFATYDESSKKTLEVDIIFGGDSVKTIALKNTLYYSDSAEVQKSEAINHAAMNTSFAQDGLEFDALNLSYSEQRDKLIMTLYATGTELDTEAKKYFLLPSDAKMSSSPIDYYGKIYKNKGFKCEATDN